MLEEIDINSHAITDSTSVSIGKGVYKFLKINNIHIEDICEIISEFFLNSSIDLKIITDIEDGNEDLIAYISHNLSNEEAHLQYLNCVEEMSYTNLLRYIIISPKYI